MQITIETSEFRNALNKILSVVDKRNTRPILTYTQIETSENEIQISATDLEVSSKIHLPAVTEGSSTFCVNAKNLFDILRELPEGKIQLSIEDDNHLHLEYQDIHYKLLIYKNDDFPHLSFGNINNEFLISSEKLLNIINKTSYAISTDETRLYLNGIYLQEIDGKLRGVATDGHRLALLDTEMETHNIETLVNGIIIPRKGVQELKKLTESFPENDIKISVDESFIYVSAEDRHFLSIRLIAREYPKYQAVIPNKTSYEIKVDRNLLLDAVKRIKIMSNEKSNGVRVKLSQNEFVFSANHPSLGDAFEKLPIQYDGKEMEIGFNAKYFIETLSVLDEGEIIMEINNELSPVIIKSERIPNFLGIIMPLKL